MAWQKGKKARQENVQDKNLQEVVEAAQKIISDNPDEGLSLTDFELEYERDYDDCVNIVLEYYTEMTYLEKKKELEAKSRQEWYEREQYEKLKKKFEGK